MQVSLFSSVLINRFHCIEFRFSVVHNPSSGGYREGQKGLLTPSKNIQVYQDRVETGVGILCIYQ